MTGLVVFFDIDGTVVDNDTQIIPESTVEAIRLLRENGHLPVVNTGRPYGHVDPRIRSLDFSGWICACGMEVILNGEYIYRQVLSHEESAYVVEHATRCGMLIQAESDTHLLYDHTKTYYGFSAREAERLAKRGIQVMPFRDVPDYTFIKFVSHDLPGCDRQGFLEAMEPLFDPNFHVGSMIEYMRKGNSKAIGMERLLTALNVPKEQTFAIGDSGNDLPMFAHAGTTICMGDGMDILKEKADYVTAPLLEDGIFKALKHFGLI